MTVSLLALLIAIVAVVKAMMTAEETAASHVTRGRVARLVETERPGANALARIVDTPARLHAASALVTGVAYAVVATAGGVAFVVAYATIPVWLAMLAGASLATLALFSFADALPRAVAVQNPEGVALAFASATLRVVNVIHPCARLLGVPWSKAIGLVVGERTPRSAWATEIEVRAASHTMEDVAREESEEALIEAVTEFTEKVVREVMIPRTDMTCIPDTATAAEAIEIIEDLGYSRLPVYHQTVDDIKGVLFAKDLLAAIWRNPSVAPATLARPAHFVPETKPVEELLKEMRTKTHIAIVADEYGGTAGLVTIEDLLEEIVGEIFDEYDSESPLLVELGDGSVRVDARLSVDDLNERFDTAIELDADTVGGVFTEVAGRIPVAGESVEIEGLRLVVEQLQGTRVTQVKVEPVSTHARREEHDA